MRHRRYEAAELDAELRRRLGALILAGFPAARQTFGDHLCDCWQERAWRVAPALAHYVAFSGAEPVAQQSIFRLSVPSNRRVFGLSDLVVAADQRGQGLARALVTAAVDDLRRAGADAVCTRTTKLAALFAELGFAADSAGRHFSDEYGRTLPDLWVWLRPEAVQTASEPLHPSDF